MLVICGSEFDCLLIRYFIIAQNLDPSIIDYCLHTNQYPLDSLTFSDQYRIKRMKNYQPKFISHVYEKMLGTYFLKNREKLTIDKFCAVLDLALGVHKEKFKGSVRKRF